MDDPRNAVSHPSEERKPIPETVALFKRYGPMTVHRAATRLHISAAGSWQCIAQAIRAGQLRRCGTKLICRHTGKHVRLYAAVEGV
jgi:hypothetical protein